MPRSLHAAALLSILLVPAGCSCAPTGTPVPGESSEAQCANGIDDDRDGAADCFDPSCGFTRVCSSGTDAGPLPSADGGSDVGPVDAPEFVCIDPIDVVFVLDVSTSMDGEAAALRDGVADIYAAANALTTDTRFGLVVFVDDALVVNDCMPFASASELSSELAAWQAFCSTNQSPVSRIQNQDCPENTLDAMHAAATMCEWRPGATHILIHVTDDTFEERGYVYSRDIFGGGGVPAMRTYSEVRDALVSREIRVGAFAMRVPEDCGAGTSPDTGRGFFTDYGALEALPVTTRGAVWDLREYRDSPTLSMADAIATMIEDEHCTVF